MPLAMSICMICVGSCVHAGHLEMRQEEETKFVPKLNKEEQNYVFSSPHRQGEERCAGKECVLLQELRAFQTYSNTSLVFGRNSSEHCWRDSGENASRSPETLEGPTGQVEGRFN